MADFDPPFADSGERRLPTSTEQANGIPCGPLDRLLFNGIFHLLNGNIGRVIAEAGITGPDGDLTKLYRAIQALIASATGSDPSDPLDTSQFVMFPQARARLPIFPEIQTSDGRMNIISPGTGQVRVPGGVNFLHRGIWLVTTTQTDIATDPSKTYHLRWNPTDGIVLRDLASGTYNPGTLPEADPSFDSTYDDMLIARIVTNSSNVPTITNLANRNRLFLTARKSGTPANLGLGTLAFSASQDVNWARTPQMQVVTGAVQADAVPAGSMDHIAAFVDQISVSRYVASGRVRNDWVSGATFAYSGGYLDFNLAA